MTKKLDQAFTKTFFTQTIMNGKYIKQISILIFSCLFAFHSFGQMQENELLSNTQLNWYNLDWNTDKILGASVELAYSELLQNKEVKKTIIVAVLDNGIDVNHEDLKENIWVNPNEIEGNNIDDDANGYIDDTHGWNFLGNPNGENIVYENLEYTRLYIEYQELVDNGKIDLIEKDGTKDKQFKKAIKLYETELKKRNTYLENIQSALKSLLSAKAILKKEFGIDANSMEDLKEIPVKGSSRVLSARNRLVNLYNVGYTEEVLRKKKAINEVYTKQYLNLELNARSIVGDDPFDIEDKVYGNSDVRGPLADHGTACAGLIAAQRNNGIGINGITNNVKIMCLRTTPAGDERDKDISLAIRYAVDNGANIISMSFGKDLSPQKEFVDAAVKYAEMNGVLIIHSSGNAGRNIAEEPAFPNRSYRDGSKANNWITVGASTNTLDKNVAAVFSNYGKNVVDILSPGVDIIALDTGNTYSEHSGTSFSAPIVSGVAALIWSYYPDLSVEELSSLLIETSKYKKLKKVYAPGLGKEKRDKVRIEEITTNGGIVNLYLALKKLESDAED